MHTSVLPDCPLAALRRGHFPDRLRRAFARAAADACARHVRAGGSLSNLREDLSRIHDGRIALQPEPDAAPSPWPERRPLEEDLLRLAADWSFALPSPSLRLLFLLAFAKRLASADPAWLTWVRLWNSRLLAEKSFHLHLLHKRALQRPPPADDKGLRGHWAPSPDLPVDALHHALLSAAVPAPLHHSRRASVFTTQLLGRAVVVKHFAPNPSAWKRRLEISRARRAWAGSLALQHAGLPCPEALGWLEILHDGEVTDAWFISAALPGVTTLRDQLRRDYPRLSPARRATLRHHLRAEIRRLHAAGFYHRDLKLGNLLLDAQGSLCWIDLEDIRSGGVPFWTLVRSFYQLNGSVPRRLPRPERIAFASGFRRHFPLADHPLVLRFVEHKTRHRLQREVNRICRA
jgi:tRNA A-37 threonylcarbamoyl transferase component Bud32